MDKLNSEVGQHPNVAEIRGKGLLIGIEIVKEKEGLICFDENEKVTSQIMMKGLEDGVFLYPGGTGEFRDIICLGPAFTIGDEEIELMVNAVKNSLNFIKSNASKAINLLKPSDPNELIDQVKKSTGHFHIYTFGGLKETNKWLVKNNYA